MGLTIRFRISTRRQLGSAGAHVHAQQLRTAAVQLGAENVSTVFAVGSDFTGAFHWPRCARKFSDLLPPLEGWLCTIEPGACCEGIYLGLCRYAGVPGWRLAGYCKTQYAARHGWEHFRNCHRLVVELLRVAGTLDLRVGVTDEGGLWETGSDAVLRRRLAGCDRMVACMGGVLQDAAAECGVRVRGPIYDDPRFERLEAEGRRDLTREFATRRGPAQRLWR